MPANIINAGVPLSGAAAGPKLWTLQCDASSNRINVAAPSDLVIPVNGANGAGAIELPLWVQALDQIEQVIVTGNIRGKLGDTVSLSLKHETYGVLPLLTGHSILGNLTVPYPDPDQEVTAIFGGQGALLGYQYDRIKSGQYVEFLTIPFTLIPSEVLPANSSYGGSEPSQWYYLSQTPAVSPYQITVPAHRYPYAPDSNYDNAPGGALVQQFAPNVLYFRGFRYTTVNAAKAEPSIVSATQFSNLVFDNGVQNTNQGYSSSTSDPWDAFNQNFGPYGNNQPFTEQLYSNYNAQDWIVTKVVRTVTNYTVFQGINFFIATRVIDNYFVTFLKWDAIVWTVYPQTTATWFRITSPLTVFRYYPPDYADYVALSERTDPLNATSLAWKGMAADGVWSLEYSATSQLPAAAVASTIGTSTAYSPNVTPAVVHIDNLVVTIKFKTNESYVNSALAPTVPTPGTTQIYTQGDLRNQGDDRALIAILCGVNGSTSMGILAGYSVLRTGRTGEIYSISYFVATTCNVNNINATRLKQSISYFGQNWGDRPFSTKGDAGEAFVLGPALWRNYPVRGQIGLNVSIVGNKLTFQLAGQYPPLVFVDPSVALINTYTRISLNS